MKNATIERKTRKASEIQSACVYRCTIKASREVFYLVASDSQPGTWHVVRFDSERVAWTCGCPSYRPCRHEKAVQEVMAAKRELERLARIESVLLPECPICHKRYENADHGCVAPSAEKRAAFEQVVAQVREIENRTDPIAASILGESFAQDLDAHVEDSIASGELDWIDAERAAWAVATPEQKREWLCTEFDLSYGDEAA